VAAIRLFVPTGLAVLLVSAVRDPTYRFPLLALLLPLFVRGAAAALGIEGRRERPSTVVRVFSTIGFAAFVVGWLLTFAVLGFVLAIGAGFEPSTDLLKTLLFLAGAGLILAAWFFWPWYAGDALGNWPTHDVRIWTSSGNRWDRVFTAWRLQKMAESGTGRWRGFGATALAIAATMVIAGLGANEGRVARVAEIAVLLLLPFVHMVIVREADALCAQWAQRVDDAR